MNRRIEFTAFHATGVAFFAAGLVLAAYHGLAQFDVLPALAWVSWSHIHFVTIGGFTQLLFGTLPGLSARRLGRPAPTAWSNRLRFLGLNGAFFLLWYGRGWGHTWAFDLGLAVVWAAAASLFLAILRMALQADDGWDATVGLFLTSTFVFLWGITYAYGLFAHVWSVPGGWLGLREAHVHANAWGFLGLAAIGTLYDQFPRLVGTELHSERLRDYSVPLLVAGIFPLIVGPWIGMGRTVTATGLVLFAAGFALFLYNLVRTYLAGERSGIAASLLAAQFWLLGPAGFAPFVLFGIEWVEPAYIEDGALHFFFMGWALPIALAGLLLVARSGLSPGGEADANGASPPFPSVPSTLTVVVWNLAVLVVGVGFFYQEAAWTVPLFASGYAVLIAIWLASLARVGQVRLSDLRGGPVPIPGGR